MRPTDLARDTGMTLVEMLVVLAITGVMSGATVLAISTANRAEDLRIEGQRLASRINAAADAALVTNSRWALDWDARGYQIVGPASGGAPAGSAAAAPRHDLPRGVSRAGRASPVVIDPDAPAPPITLALASSKERLEVRLDGLSASISPAEAR